MAGVTLINCFEVPAGREEEFFGLWKQVNQYMRTKAGYLGHRLHRSLAPDATYRFVNVAQWDSAASFQAAHDDGFRALVGRQEWRVFPHHPVLYEAIHEGQAESVLAGR